MKKHPLAALVAIFCYILCAGQNLQPLGNLQYGSGVYCAGITGYVSPDGSEYALVCKSNGLSIVAITDPSNPLELFSVPCMSYDYVGNREVSQYKGYAYVVSEKPDSLLIVNLNYLPDSIVWHRVSPGGITKGHTIFIDEKGIAYINGSKYGYQYFLDLNADPYDPPFVGSYTNDYVHDCFVRNDTMWAACINSGKIRVIDVRDKTMANSTNSQIADWNTPQNFTHNCWLSDDSRYIFTTDEKPNAPLTCYDVTDLSNVTETCRTVSDSGSNTVIHNTTYLNDYCITGYYTYGVTIHDVRDKNNIIEVGHFDTSPGYSSDGFNGCWAAWPYLPSGNIIASDIETGLWILKPTYSRSALLNGTVKDSNGSYMNGVKVELTDSGIITYTNYQGQYYTGVNTSGFYTVRFSKPGYQTITIDSVLLTTGTTTTLNAILPVAVPAAITILTVDEQSAQPVANVHLHILDNVNSYQQYYLTDNNGKLTTSTITEGQYNIYAGTWGYVTSLSQKLISDNDTIIIPLKKGYYDDAYFDFGWAIYSSAQYGAWQRCVPNASYFNNMVISPVSDIENDFGTQCFSTGNQTSPLVYPNVDGGFTVLVSPAIDLSEMEAPYLNYYWWFTDTFGLGGYTDELSVYLLNETDTVKLNTHNAQSPQRQWVYDNIRIRNYIQPTSNMHLVFWIADTGIDNYVKGSIDKIQITDSADALLSTGPVFKQNQLMFTAYPNPFSNSFTVYVDGIVPNNCEVEILNTIGQPILRQPITTPRQHITLPGTYTTGLLYARLVNNGQQIKSLKLIKTD